MRLIKFILAIAINLFSSFHYGQDSNDYLKYDIGFSADYINQGDNFISAGGIIGKNIGKKNDKNQFYGLYYDQNLNQPSIGGPRLKMVYNYLGIFGVGMNVSNYGNLNQVSNRYFILTPEINFSYFGLVNLSLGYSIGYVKDFLPFKVGINFNFVKSK